MSKQNPQETDAPIDKMRRRSNVTNLIINSTDKLPILERIDILEDILETLVDSLPPDRRAIYEQNHVEPTE